jgi:hypothetical protein
LRLSNGCAHRRFLNEALMMKSEQKRLDRSTKTGVISNKSQASPPSRPEVVLRCPNHSTAGQKKVDQSP